VVMYFQVLSLLFLATGWGPTQVARLGTADRGGRRHLQSIDFKFSSPLNSMQWGFGKCSRSQPRTDDDLLMPVE